VVVDNSVFNILLADFLKKNPDLKTPITQSDVTPAPFRGISRFVDPRFFGTSEK
jgi:hypothetical protein